MGRSLIHASSASVIWKNQGVGAANVTFLLLTGKLQVANLGREERTRAERKNLRGRNVVPAVVDLMRIKIAPPLVSNAVCPALATPMIVCCSAHIKADVCEGYWG